MRKFVIVCIFLLTANVTKAETNCYETEVAHEKKSQNEYSFSIERECELTTTENIDWRELLVTNKEMIIQSADAIHYQDQQENEAFLDITKTIDNPNGSLVISSNYFLKINNSLEINERSYEVKGTGNSKTVTYTGSYYELRPIDQGYLLTFYLEAHLKKPRTIPLGVFKRFVFDNMRKDSKKETAKHLDNIKILASKNQKG